MKKLSLSSSSNNSPPPPPDPNELYSLPAIKRLQRSINFKLSDSSEKFLLKRKKKNESYCRIPLTERNIETLRCERLGIEPPRNGGDILAIFEEEEQGEEERDREEEEKNARHELRRKREVQVSEWLRKLP